MEVWKDVVGYEGMYQVSNLGRVRSLGRYVSNNPNGKKKRYIEGRVLIPNDNSKGYKYVCLSVEQKHAHKYVHRLVAEAFLSNPHHYEQINHKDENKWNNNVNNLEWCNSQYNMDYSRSREVIQIDRNTNEIVGVFKSAREAGRQTECISSSIVLVCNKVWKHTHGFLWKWRDEVMI